MKIISFTMVNNESEIIESFIRYNYNFVDEMVIIDNGCTDSTIKIINLLIQEGYKITIYDESLEAYNQFRLDNKYLDKIINEKEADIILPLDADEFLIADGNPREELEKLDLNKIYYVNWQWYVMTKEDDSDEMFIPRRMKYCLKKPAWNYSDGTLVTKVIVTAAYYKKMHLKMAMGHHTVFGNDKVEVMNIDNIRFAHYRAIGVDQLIYKTTCYTIRDIATMENNFETAQRTNQMAAIESGKNMWDAAEEASYGGYDREIIEKPIDLSVCSKSIPKIKYPEFAKEDLSHRVIYTGREMAIRAYNEARAKKEKPFLKPIIIWLDGIKGDECIFPDPSNHLTLLTQMYNVRGLLTTKNEIRFLKANFRLIVTPDYVKFIPHEYIVIPDTVDFTKIKEEIVRYGIPAESIICLKEYRHKLGIGGNIISKMYFFPSMAGRLYQYISRNGVKNTIRKVQERMGK